VSGSRKEAIHRELVEHLSAEIAAAMAAHKKTREGATHEEAKPENDKDTRALEQSYVARGQATRVHELEAALADTEKMQLRAFDDETPIALGALVVAMEDDAEIAFFLAPAGGGHVITSRGDAPRAPHSLGPLRSASRSSGDVQVVTPQSPIGRALLGKHVGDETEIVIAGKKRSLEIVAVS